MYLLSRLRHITKGFETGAAYKRWQLRGWKVNMTFEIVLKWHLAR